MDEKKRKKRIVIMVILFIYLEFFCGGRDYHRTMHRTKMTQTQILAECPELEFTDEIKAWVQDVTEKAVEKNIADVIVKVKENIGKKYSFQKYIPEIVYSPEELGVTTALFPDADKCEIKIQFTDDSDDDDEIITISCNVTVKQDISNMSTKYNKYEIRGKYGDSFDKYSQYSNVQIYKKKLFSSEEYAFPESAYYAEFDEQSFIKSVSGHKWFAFLTGFIHHSIYG